MPPPKELTVAIVAPFPPPPAGMTLQAAFLADVLARDGARVVRVNTNPYGRRKPRLPRFLRMLRELEVLRACDLALVFAGSYGSFFAFSAVPLALAARRGVPALVMYKGGLARPFFRRWGWLVRRCLASARRVVVPGRFLAGVFEEFGMEATVVPDIIRTDELARREGPPPGPPVLFNPRRHVPVCGVGVLVRAFAAVAAAFPDARLELCGDGPERARLERLAASLPGGERVRFHGFVPPDALRAFYERATVMVNANRDDNHPNSVLEAMAAGLPVVATAVGGVPFLIRDGETGFLCPPDDADALAARIIAALANPARAAAVAEHARAAVQEFIWPYGRDGHLGVLLQLAGIRH